MTASCGAGQTGESDLDLATGDLLSAFEQAPIGMGVVRADGSLVAVNRALGLLLGRPASALLGTTLFDVTEPDDVPAALEACASIGSGHEQVLRHECRFRHSDGSVRWVLVSSSRLPRDGRGLRIVLHVEDVTERRELEDRLRQQALHDPLTGLPNRLLLLDRAEHALAAGRRARRPVSLLFLDLDGFKAVNDTHGHDAGDRVLQTVAHRIEQVLRPGDTAARLGGDEFVVLCPDTTAEQGVAVAQRLRDALAGPLGLEDVHLSVSVGASLQEAAGPDEDTTELALALLRQADRRMYDVKGSRTRQDHPGSGPDVPDTTPADLHVRREAPTDDR